MFNFFDKCYCINLDKRTDRWEQCEAEFTKVGIQVERFKAYEGDNRVLAFNKSQYYCIQKALADGCERFLILEDDVEFRNWGHLGAALQELPSNWRLLQLGCNLIGCGGMEFRCPIPYSPYLAVLVDAWQTHAVAYTREMGQWIIDNFPFHKDEYKVEGCLIYDEWLRQNVLPKFFSFVVRPQIALQRPSYSDIWDNMGDYSSLFERGNELMK